MLHNDNDKEGSYAHKVRRVINFGEKEGCNLESTRRCFWGVLAVFCCLESMTWFFTL